MERYFQVALYLMMLSGFATLAQTGQVDPLTVLLMVGALTVRGYFLLTKHPFLLGDRSTKLLTIAFAAFYPVDLFLISGTFVSATVHLVLALMVVRIFSARRDRDHVFLAILSFLLVLAASVLTVNSAFLITFIAFLLAAVATFVLLEIRRSMKTVAPASMSASHGIQRIGRSLFRLVPALVVSIVILALAIFFFLPRISAGYLSAYSSGNELSTGFSNQVELGRIGEIQQSDSVVMHIQIDGDTHGGFDLKWRGIALNNFDGRTWRNSSQQIVVPRSLDGRFLLSQFDPELRHSSSSQGGRIHYRVLLEPLGTSVFFLAPKPEALSGNYRFVTTDDGGAFYDLDREHPPSVYEADSKVNRPSAQDLRSASADFSSTGWQKYLQLPAVDPRVADLARQITSGAHNNFDRASAIERHLSTSYAYTLQLGRSTPKDPLTHFLFERKAGHCEYFASSMAVMLRTLNIPSRIVNGFRTGEFNDVNSQYLVRERNAHSWVEAYFPGYGWISFDPTPAVAMQTHNGFGRIALYMDAAASFWREWVVNYDFGHQKSLGEGATRSTRGMVDRVRFLARRQYIRMVGWARTTQNVLQRSPHKWGIGAMVAVILLIVAVNARHLWQILHLRWVAAHPDKDPQQAASVWYDRLTKSLARHGLRKSPVQTPSEFLRTIENPSLRQEVERFTRHYESARFGDSSDDAARLPELYDEITSTSRR